MSEPAADSKRAPIQAAGTNGDLAEVPPTVLADQVAILTGREGGVNAGVLPIWNRVEHRRASRWLWWLAFGGWCATVFLIIVAGLRIVQHDAAAPLMWLNAFTTYVYLPAYAVLAFAAWQRRWWLAAASALVVACHVAWVAPDFRPATPYPSQAAGTIATTPVRIYFANVRAHNEMPDAILKDIAAANADVIALAEMNRWWRDKLREAPFMKAYQYGTDLNQPIQGEVMVFSRLPISHQEIQWAVGRVIQMIDLPLGNETLRVLCLHSPRPLQEEPQEYTVFWDNVKPFIAKQPEPLVVIGDFNATQHSRVYKELTTGRLRSAHTDRGRGYATSWPNGTNPLPPIRIDQALLSPQVECLDIEEGPGSGSDHKSLILDVSVHSLGPAAVSAVTGR